MQVNAFFETVFESIKKKKNTFDWRDSAADAVWMFSKSDVFHNIETQ